MSHEIGAFLQSRRARISPAEVGLPVHGRRRVPGLRREELAQLAGISIDYYTRLEQGRSPNASDSVLDAIAGVLRLDATERAHLRNLLRPVQRRPRPTNRVRPGLTRLLETMDDVPAFVMGRRSDILAYNDLGDALYGLSELPPAEHNAARHTFLHPGARDFYHDWPTVAAETVAHLHLDAGRHPDDPRLATLIGELSMKSDTFRRLWAQRPIKERTHGLKHIRHPLVGDLELSYETFPLPGEPDQALVTYTASPDSATEERLALLASWRASQPFSDRDTAE